MEEHPQYELAKKQMCIPMGLFSIELDATNEKIEQLCNKLQYFKLAVSWGGHESIVIPAFILGNAGKGSPYPANLVRFYIGLEDADVLITDLDEALSLI